MKSEAIKLYYRPGTCALAPYMALEEVGADYQAIDLTGNAELLATVNPRGKVPVLRVGGRVLRENVAILYFIAGEFPHAGLLPLDLEMRAECLSTVAWFSSTLHIDYRRFVKPFVFSPVAEAHAGIKEEGRLHYVSDLAELNAHLKGKTWMHGDHLSIADLYGLVFIEWAVTSSLYERGWSHITQWAQGLLQRPAIIKVLQVTGSPLLGRNVF